MAGTGMRERDAALRLRQWLFEQLYHRLAWAYDAIAAFTSLGRWYLWMEAVTPYIRGPRVLEIGPGTGHLLENLAGRQGMTVFGVDESRQMLRLAQRRVHGKAHLLRGMAQRAPVASGGFDTIVSTFPADFIRDPGAMREMHRILRPGGQLVILAAAKVLGSRPLEKLWAWALDAVGEVPRDAGALIAGMLGPLLTQAGFRPELHELKGADGVVFVLVAAKAIEFRRERSKPAKLAIDNIGCGSTIFRLC